MANLYDEQTQEERLMESYEQMLGNKAVVYDLRVADAVDFLLKKRKELSDSIVKERYRRTIQSQLVYEYGDLVVVAWMAIVLLFLVDSFIKGALTIGLFITLVGALQQIIDSFRKIGDEYSELQRRIMFVDYYLSFMRLEETAERGSGDLELEEEGVRFEHVTFTYPGKTEPALRDVSFVMKPRTRRALVGENGSGKSTLIKLMCGLYKPDSGRILINGRDTAELDSRALIRNFSVIFQDYGRYFFTVQENVELGDIDKMSRSQEQREPEVKAALHEGLSDELAERLRQPLGNLSEDGIELSGGQWQRLALSRACYRDSEILILDEPTASLDPVAENELYANFIEMMKNRSCILISHRLAVARYVDRILVLQRGELIEDGDHEALMRKNGAYASMYYAQSHWYII
ncbi:ABC transporter ATP-binding protein [Acetatifactor aquisgranensis]|uniref:ABC transporter ATP-binding protein n=1 Tax=Acetatifactor aquisgranensis TaxID=2941233 RepID=UPI00203F2089|nr:ABC transporter ATP-binding protein [Acetatifactor aquisgranensis]